MEARRAGFREVLGAPAETACTYSEVQYAFTLCKWSSLLTDMLDVTGDCKSQVSLV